MPTHGCWTPKLTAWSRLGPIEMQHHPSVLPHRSTSCRLMCCCATARIRSRLLITCCCRGDQPAGSKHCGSEETYQRGEQPGRVSSGSDGDVSEERVHAVKFSVVGCPLGEQVCTQLMDVSIQATPYMRYLPGHDDPSWAATWTSHHPATRARKGDWRLAPAAKKADR